MDKNSLLNLAEQLVAGDLSPKQFAEQAANQTPKTLALDSASLDLDRKNRCGYPEVVYGEGKPVEILSEILTALINRGEAALATRIDPDKATALQKTFPSANYNQLARTIRIQANHGSKDRPTVGHVAIITAGTSDLPVAEEARETLDWMGVDVTMVHDVGVAGPHRLPQRLSDFADADAIVVVAGMEGALPSVVGGFVGCPVIAVPTSVGYGANLGGIAALLSMLNSCASNVAVVNIDAGFKAAYLAGLIAQRCHKSQP